MSSNNNQIENEIYALAVEFSSVLNSWLTLEEMREVISRNIKESEKDICHSHDFCDANMAMHEVFMLHGMDVTSESGVSDFGQKWGEVWQLAKSERFFVSTFNANTVSPPSAATAQPRF